MRLIEGIKTVSEDLYAFNTRHIGAHNENTDTNQPVWQIRLGF